MRRTRRARRRILPASALILLAILPRPSSTARDKGPFRIAAGPYARKTEAEGGPLAGRLILKGLTVQVEYLDAPGRAAFIRSIDPSAGDPLAVAAGQAETFTSFRVEFDNDSDADVTFQPGNVVLITDRNEQQFPVDLTDLYRAAEAREAPDPQRLIDRAARFIFDLSTTVPKGKRLARLLLFGPLPQKWREFRLHFSYLQIGTETHTLSFPFHKQSLAG